MWPGSMSDVNNSIFTYLLTYIIAARSSTTKRWQRQSRASRPSRAAAGLQRNEPSWPTTGLGAMDQDVIQSLRLRDPRSPSTTAKTKRPIYSKPLGFNSTPHINTCHAPNEWRSASRDNTATRYWIFGIKRIPTYIITVTYNALRIKLN